MRAAGTGRAVTSRSHMPRQRQALGRQSENKSPTGDRTIPARRERPQDLEDKVRNLRSSPNTQLTAVPNEKRENGRKLPKTAQKNFQDARNCSFTMPGKP